MLVGEAENPRVSLRIERALFLSQDLFPEGHSNSSGWVGCLSWGSWSPLIPLRHRTEHPQSVVIVCLLVCEGREEGALFIFSPRAKHRECFWERREDRWENDRVHARRVSPLCWGLRSSPVVERQQPVPTRRGFLLREISTNQRVM